MKRLKVLIALFVLVVVAFGQSVNVDRLERKAKRGNAEAQTELGSCYYAGIGVAQSYKTAAYWLEKAAVQGNPSAQHILGCMYFQGEGVAKDRAKAVEWCTKAAEQGHDQAQYVLGYWAYTGALGKKDYTTAAYWLHKSAEQGYAPAQYYYGQLYYWGNGVAKDRETVARWWRKAAEQGYADAQNDLGECYFYGDGVEENDAEAVAWWRKAGSQGHAKAIFHLGEAYEDGWGGLEKSFVKAMNCYMQAADKGSDIACLTVGGMFEYGENIKQNIGLAIKYYEMLLRLPDGAAETTPIFKEVGRNRLAAIYGLGKGNVKRDIPKAYELLKDHLDSDTEAQLILGESYYQEGNYVQAVKYLERASKSNAKDTSGAACFSLSKCYRFGRGVSQDIAKADALQKEALEKGWDEAKSLDDLLKNMR